MLVLLCALLLSPPLASAQVEEPSPEAAPDHGPGARVRLAGLHGFSTTSRLTTAGAPDARIALEVSYAFPDRTRWLETSGEGANSTRLIRYGFGDRVFVLKHGQRTSEALDADWTRETRLRFDLRRAVFLFPDGYEWSRDGLTWTTDLGPRGTLTAQFESEAPDARPTWIQARSKAGDARGKYSDLEWGSLPSDTPKLSERLFPLSARLSYAKTELWRENLESVASLSTSDRFFLPTDRRDLAAPLRVSAKPFLTDVAAVQVRRVPLTGTRPWKLALQEAARGADQLVREMGENAPALDPRRAFELDDAGRPVALLLRLPPGHEGAVTGFTPRPRTSGAAILLGDLSEIRPQLFAPLRERLGSPPGAAYVVYDPAGEAGQQVTLILPAKTD